MTTTIGSLDLNAFNDLYSDSNQYFWFEGNASATYGAGVHITLSPDTSFITNPTGQNILMNTDGISIRNGLLPMMTLDNDSLDFNVVDTTAGTYTTTATFTATGAQIGQSDGAHSVIDVNGQRFYVSTVNGIMQLANIGYGEVNNGNVNSMGAYYSFGTRAIPINEYSTSRVYSIGNTCIYNGVYYVCIADIDEPGSFNNSYWDKLIGALSFASGFSTIASGYASHAEGDATKALDMNTHAEGHYTIASMSSSHAEGYMTHAHGLYSHTEGRETFADAYASHAEGYQTVATISSGSGSLPYGSHAEGMYTQASGQASHAEGNYSQSIGDFSHAQNMYTIATEQNQTVIGKYNSATVSGSGTTEDPYTYSDVGNYAFIIGNGTSNTTANRSNALMVDWNGDIYPQATKMADFVVDQGTDNNWFYRKWNSGRYEAWLRYNATGMALTSASSNTYYNATSGVKNVTLPSFNVGTDYYVTGQEQPSMSSSVYIYSIQTYSATQMQVSYRAHASTANAQCNGMFYLMGKWK